MKRGFLVLGIVLLAITLLSVVINYQYFNKADPPKEWWGKQITIEQVEKEHTKEIEAQISRIKEAGVSVYDRDKDALVKASPAEVKSAISKLESQKELNTLGWNKLKSLYKKGDVILRYAAPPLSGSAGYILVRDNKVIYKYEVWIQ